MESSTSTSCSQPPALGGDTYQLLSTSFTFSHKHWFSSCPWTVTAEGIRGASENAHHLTHRTAEHLSALLQVIHPKKCHIFPDIFVLQLAAGRGQ